MFFGFALAAVALIMIDAAVTKRSPIGVINNAPHGSGVTVATGATGVNGSNPTDTSTIIPSGSGGFIAKDAYAGLSVERTDQGKDFGGKGAVKAVANGVVLRNTLWAGWPGTGGVVYRTLDGNVYVMEDFTASVHIGEPVKAGEVIGHATGGSNGIETGWANALGTGPLTPYDGAPDGTATLGGKSFAKFLGLS